jgi:hypothetical protein
MKNYKIKSVHDIYIDSYEQGEVEQSNSYTLNSEIQANDINEAISLYFENVLFYKFDFANCSISDDKKVIHYSVLCDSENSEASKSEMELWKKNKLTLYSNNIEIEIFELVKCEITN